MSSRPDGYHPYLLKNIVSTISSPFCLLFHFLSIGSVPTAWKIVYFYKKGYSSDPFNYRPISLISVFSKLMERKVVSDNYAQIGLPAKSQFNLQAAPRHHVQKVYGNEPARITKWLYS